MKLSIINILLLSTAVTTLAISSPADARKGGKKGKRVAEAIFTRLDLNTDSTITLDELLANVDEKSQKKLDRADTDSSTEIEFTEFTQKKRHMKDLSEYATDIVACVQALKDEDEDEDDDSNIIVPSVEKFAAPQDKFDAFDSNANGGLDITEISSAMTTRRSDSFAVMDADDSNAVTIEEFKAHIESKKATRKAVKSCINEIVDDSDPV